MSLVVDSSAVLAILLDERSAPAVEQGLAGSDESVMSAATLVEATIVAEARLGPAGGQHLERVVREAAIAIALVTHEVAVEAIDGWRTFGKGRHPAGLNLGDCFTYGLARHRNAPVLCTEDDFGATDVPTLPG